MEKGLGAGSRSNFTVENPGIHCYLTQVISVNINNGKTY